MGKVLSHSCKIGVVKGVDTPRTLSQGISSGAFDSNKMNIQEFADGKSEFLLARADTQGDLG